MTDTLDRVKDMTNWRAEDDELGAFGTPPESWVVAAAAIAAGVATRRTLMTLWRQTRESDPPVNPTAPGVGWSDAVIWGLAVGAAVGVARVCTRRAVTSAGRKYFD